MPYRMAGIDVHKKRLAVVVADVEGEDEYQFERRWYGSKPEQLRVRSGGLIGQEVTAVGSGWGGGGRVFGKVGVGEGLCNRGGRGRKTDFRDAERLVKRLVSQELILSFVPDTEQRLWRTLTRTRYQRTRDKVRLQNQL